MRVRCPSRHGIPVPGVSAFRFLWDLRSTAADAVAFATDFCKDARLPAVPFAKLVADQIFEQCLRRAKAFGAKARTAAGTASGSGKRKLPASFGIRRTRKEVESYTPNVKRLQKE